MSGFDWQQIISDSIPAIISGLVIALIVYGLDERRARRELKLKFFMIASSWEVSEPKVSMRNFNLAKTNLSGYDLSNANLEMANLSKSELWATELENANLRKTNFYKAELVGTNFTNVTAWNANFSNSTITNHEYANLDHIPKFVEADLFYARFKNATIMAADYKNANLNGSDFTGAVVRNCDFSNANFENSKWLKVKHVENCIWKEVKNTTPEMFSKEIWEEIQRQNAE